MHTVKMFWTRKRFLKLFLFAVLLADLTFICVGQIARSQVVGTAVRRHDRVYSSYMAAVDRAKKAPAPDGGEPVSHFWKALRETRKQYPHLRLSILMKETAEGEREKRVLEMLRTRSHDWMISDEQDGWTRSFYSLPTKNTAALQVVADVREELAAWKTTSAVIGGYAFMLLFAFGWFWTRALDQAPAEKALEQDQVAEKLRALQRLMLELESTITASRSSLAAVERAHAQIDDIAAQIRLLAVNGSIEAARSAETYRVFHVIMNEVNQHAIRLRELSRADGSFTALRERLDQLQTSFAASAAAAAPAPSSRVSFRRVG